MTVKQNSFIVIYYFRVTSFKSLESSSGPLIYIMNLRSPIQLHVFVDTFTRCDLAFIFYCLCK